VAGVCAAAVGVRLLFAWRFLPPLESDFYWYREAGLEAARRGVLSLFSANPPVPMWVLSVWPPLYPVFLGLLYSVYGGIAVAPVVQAVLGGLSCLAIFAAARRHGGNAWLAAGVMALYPQAVVYSAVHGTETLSVFLMSLVVWISMTALRPRQAAWYGVLLGLTTLSRAHALMLLPGVVISLWQRRRALLLVCLFLVLSLLPWSVNRSLIYGRPVFMTTFFGHLLYMGNYHENTAGGYYPAPSLVEIPGNVTAPEEDVYYLTAGMREILLHPGHYVLMCGRRLLTWIGVDYDEWVQKYAPRWLAGLSLWAQIALFLSAAAAGMRSWREAEARRVILPALSLVALTLLSYHMPRYSLIAVPYFAVIASRWREPRVGV